MIKDKDKSRIQSCIDHINTAIDVDPWAKELVIEMGAEILKNLNIVQPEIMADGTLHITVNADVANIDRILLSQAETHSGDLYYKDAKAEIVRCKDCRHSEHWYRDKSRCFLWHEEGVDVFEDGFCSYAERRTND